MNAKRVAADGLALALALVLGFVDNMIPMPVPVAGIKLGLANLVILFAICRMGYADATLISISRVILSGLLFSGMSGIIYSFAGAVLSFAVMALIKRYTDYHIVVVSVCGSLAHIVGQLCVASMIVGVSVAFYYGPLLLLSALIAGTLIGVLTASVVRLVRY